MTEKELKKLNRYQLLEMLIIQTERANELEKKLEEAQKKLDQRDIQMTVIGSIAEASVQISGVLEAAQRAADMYLEAAKARIDQMEAEQRKKLGNDPAQPEKESIDDYLMEMNAFVKKFSKG